MADSKYANLPGIAYDQPDVYETSDLPEVDQASLDIADESESVEKVSLNAKEAFGKFKGKNLDASQTDFSDRISHSRRIGYDVTHGEYEMVGEEKEKETPQQKYQRLQHELRELMEEVNEIKETAKNDDKTSNQSTVVLGKQAEKLQNQLLEFHLEQTLGSELIANISDPQGTLQKRLLSQVENLKTSGLPPSKPAKKETKKETQVSNDHVIYELHCKPEQAKFLEAAKFAEMEERFNKIEAVIGYNSDKLTVLAGDTNEKSLLSAVAVLNSKINLLDPEQLDQVESRLQLLSQKLNQINEKKTAVEEIEKQNKVAEVYELLQKTEALCVSLPEILGRMTALKELHEQALQFSKALTQLDATQQQISNSVKDNQKILKQVQEHFAKNMDIVKNNIGSLEKRLSAIKK